MSLANWAEQGRADFAALARLCAASALTNGAFFLLALGELWIGFEPWQTIAVNFPLAVVVSFLLSRNWVFGDRGRDRTLIVRYVTVYLVTYVLAMSLAHGLDVLGLHEALAVLFTLIPAAIGLFLGLNYWVFPKKARAAAEEV